MWILFGAADRKKKGRVHQKKRKRQNHTSLEPLLTSLGCDSRETYGILMKC